MIAPEGKPIILWGSLAVLAIHVMVGFYVWPIWLFIFILIWLYRSPQRVIPSAPLGIVSPTDGGILAVEHVHDPFLKRDAFCLRLKTHWYGGFVLRSVTEGKIMNYWAPQPGKRGAYAVWIQTDEQDDVVMAIQPLNPFSRIRQYLMAGERVGQGRPCGFVMLGAKIDVYLATQARSERTVGQKVLGGQDLIAELVH